MVVSMNKYGMAAVLMLLALRAPGQEPSSRVSVSTIPDKAAVTCDGILREETPVLLTGLRPGPHLIQVEKPGFLPARRTVMLQAGQPAALEIPLERLTGLILVKVVPAGADIEINGAHRGTAPLLLADLPPRKYRIKASLAGYLSRDVEVEVENRIPKAVAITLPSDSAKLSIRSTPPGAAVTVNGLSKGTTPCQLDRLSAGNNEIEVTLAEYEVYRARLKLQANEEQQLDVTLKAVPSSLSVISTPTGARLFVDDALRGQTPLTLDNLEAGSHVLRAEKEGYEPATRTVEIQRAQKKVEELPLSPNVGTLDVLAKPSGVTVLVDGVDKGSLTPKPDESAGALSLELPVGDHRVALVLKGYGPVERRVVIRRGETVSLKEILKRVFVPDVRVTMMDGTVLTGILAEKLPNGDLKLETQFGIFKTLESVRIDKLEKLPPPPVK